MKIRLSSVALFSMFLLTSQLSQAAGSWWKCANSGNTTRLEWTGTHGGLFGAYHTLVVVSIDGISYGNDDEFNGPILKMINDNQPDEYGSYVLAGSINGKLYQVNIKQNPSSENQSASAEFIDGSTGFHEDLNCKNFGF